MDWLRVIQWISIGLCWGAIALNIVAFVRTHRTYRQLCESLLKSERLEKLLEQEYNKMTENSENKEGDTNDENN